MTDEVDFFQINENRLDKEWLRQPDIFYTYACKLADAKREAEQAKAELKLVTAELDHAIRKDPASHGLKKDTDKPVENCIVRQKKYQVALGELIEAEHTVDIAQAAVSTLDHRKKALENLVQLRLANYYSEPRAPKGATREHAEQWKHDDVFKAKRRAE